MGRQDLDLPVRGKAGLCLLDIGHIQSPKIDVKHLGETSLKKLKRNTESTLLYQQKFLITPQIMKVASHGLVSLKWDELLNSICFLKA